MAKQYPLKTALSNTMIKDVPSYGNKFFYSLGFLSMISFLMLVITGIVLSFYGPTWWLTSEVGKYVRSVHLWATQAFVLFVLLHLLIVFLTSGFKKPRRTTWIIGVLMLFIVLAETEFGYVLRGDFSSQWRGLQGADFYNGSGLGHWINPLNYGQIYGIHIAVVPIAIIGLLLLHYLLVKVLGIAKPYRQDVSVRTVPANHKLLFARGGVLVGLILVLGLIFPSPYLKPENIQNISQQDPNLFAKTVLAEWSASSDTATYMDNINPYKYNTKAVYVDGPYANYLLTKTSTVDALNVFNNQPESVQKAQLKAASDYYEKENPDPKKAPKGPVVAVLASLTQMAQAGLYQPVLAGANSGNGAGDNSTYVLRFIADTGATEDKATQLKITTPQYGMVREETGSTPGAWWLSPIGLLNHTVLAGDENGDRDAAIIFGSLLLTMLAFPFIPWVNQIPDKLRIYKLIWREKK